MIAPAITYKAELEKQFSLLAYTEKMMWYNGSIENYHHEIEEEGDKYAFAIVHSGQVIGYISFRVDWYCSMAFNFGLIRFLPIYFDNEKQEYKDSTPIMVSAIREVIRMIRSYDLHRIDFRCVGGNPAEKRYYKIVQRFKTTYRIRLVRFFDNIKDRQGRYHDTIMYELIKKEADNDR